MKISKASTEYANRIFRLCSQGGVLNEDHLRLALSKMNQNPPKDHKGILNALKRLTRLDVEKRTATVQSATELTSADKSRIETSLNQKFSQSLIYNYSVNPELLGGLKVRVGSHVLDGTVLSRINRLAQSI